MKLTIDFETRSACDIRKCGGWRYAEDETTDVMCLAVKADEGPTRLWVPARYEHVAARDFEGGLSDESLARQIHFAAEIEAHNAHFEIAIWRNVMMPRYGSPDIPDHKWRCSAAKAASFALPRSLEGAGAALGLSVQKDMEGSRIMKKLAKPRKPREDEPPGLYWNEDPEDLLKLFRYCIRDVEAEHAISKALSDLSPQEQRIWQLDLKMNARGVLADVDSAGFIVWTIRRHEALLLKEVEEITEGKIQSVKQVAAMCEYCGTESLDKAAVAEALDREQPADVRRLLEIRQCLALSSVSKFEAILQRASENRRLRGMLLYHGASTGRWTGKGVQLQNLPRMSFPADETELALRLFREGDLDGIDTFFGDPLQTAKALIRPMLTAAPGNDLICADYASIEARVLLWLAGDEAGLELFRSGADIYCDMASAIYDREITKKDKRERQVGKTAILGLGYSMGSKKFRETCWNQAGIEIEKKLARKVVKTYRAKYSKVKELWYATERAAIAAVQTGDQMQAGKARFGVRGKFLHCRLPSGRLLAYPYPAVLTQPAFIYPTVDEDGTEGSMMIVTPAGSSAARGLALKRAIEDEVRIIGAPIEREKSSLTYMGVTNGKWLRETTSGGKIVENIDQAVSRDLMAEAMLRLEAAGYPMILSVHDEAVAEVPEDFGSVAEFEAIMSEVPKWGAGIPVAAEGWRGKRYRK